MSGPRCRSSVGCSPHGQPVGCRCVVEEDSEVSLGDGRVALVAGDLVTCAGERAWRHVQVAAYGAVRALGLWARPGSGGCGSRCPGSSRHRVCRGRSGLVRTRRWSPASAARSQVRSRGRLGPVGAGDAGQGSRTPAFSPRFGHRAATKRPGHAPRAIRRPRRSSPGGDVSCARMPQASCSTRRAASIGDARVIVAAHPRGFASRRERRVPHVGVRMGVVSASDARGADLHCPPHGCASRDEGWRHLAEIPRAAGPGVSCPVMTSPPERLDHEAPSSGYRSAKGSGA